MGLAAVEHMYQVSSIFSKESGYMLGSFTFEGVLMVVSVILCDGIISCIISFHLITLCVS